jgi:gamma-glutamyl:cysteine ligase YbdK (ATP-grasp superfamily)
MSITPAGADDKSQVTPDASTPTLDEQITEALQNVDDNGKLVFADNVDPVFKALVTSKKEARDHQAAYTKSQQELHTTKAEVNVLREKTAYKPTPEQEKELEELKHTDPDAWLEKKLTYEKEARDALSSVTDEAKVAAAREALMADFTEKTGIVVTDELLRNEVPPRYMKQLEEGKIDFSKFLEVVQKFLTTDKVINDSEKTLDQTDLGKVTGGEIPSKEGPTTSTGKYVKLAQSDDII